MLLGSSQASQEQARALRSLEEQGYEKQRFRIPLVSDSACILDGGNRTACNMPGLPFPHSQNVVLSSDANAGVVKREDGLDNNSPNGGSMKRKTGPGALDEDPLVPVVKKQRVRVGSKGKGFVLVVTKYFIFLMLQIFDNLINRYIPGGSVSPFISAHYLQVLLLLTSLAVTAAAAEAVKSADAPGSGGKGGSGAKGGGTRISAAQRAAAESYRREAEAEASAAAASRDPTTVLWRVNAEEFNRRFR